MRAVLLLAHYTGWSRAEILDLDTNEFAEWVLTIPKNPR
jgi:hypothetical protein